MHGENFRVVKYTSFQRSESQIEQLRNQYLESFPSLLKKVLLSETEQSSKEIDELYEMGLFFETHIEDSWHDISLICYRLAAENGSIDAQKHMGEIFETGLKMDPDIKQAKEWFVKAKEQGSLSATKKLAFILLQEQDNADSQKRAFDLLLTLVDEYDPDCFHYLGLCYKEGCGTEVSENLAEKYLKLAEEYGYGDDEFKDANEMMHSLKKNGWQL